MQNSIIPVTSPFIPDRDRLYKLLDKAMDSKYLTNNGPISLELEEKLSNYLNYPYLSLCNNATIGLIIALKILQISGRVITSPFSFPATLNSIYWNNLNFNFVDIKPNTCNMDPDCLEKCLKELAVLSDSKNCIMPIHCYGIPVDTFEISKLAEKYNTYILTDAAHAFGIQDNSRSNILGFGDISVISSHATKVFSTIEGGIVAFKTEELKKEFDSIRNFGLDSAGNFRNFGINAKLSEFHAAFGLCMLDRIDEALEKRKQIALCYISELASQNSVRLLFDSESSLTNCSYFPIVINESSNYTRDELRAILKSKGIESRAYFYPLLSNDKSLDRKLPVAESIAQNILCLPIFPDLEIEQVKYISRVLIDLLAS